jgi:hypothetical protein
MDPVPTMFLEELNPSSCFLSSGNLPSLCCYTLCPEGKTFFLSSDFCFLFVLLVKVQINSQVFHLFYLAIRN